MSDSERALLIFAGDTDSMEELQHALNAVKHAPYKPNPAGAPYGAPQEQYSEAEVNQFAMQHLRAAMPHVNFTGSAIVP